jgi:regulator of sigma E protease
VTHLNFVRNEEVTPYEFGVKTVASGNSYVWEDFGLYFKVTKAWAPFDERVKGTFQDFGRASVAVFKGLGMIFTGGIKNMSGIVGILNFSSTVLNNYSFSYYIYLWGLISVNLAIFNLLPFPGLDGWALLVTAIEGGVNSVKRAKYKKQNADISSFQEWKIPSKIKNIVSFIGLALLMLLMIAIVVLDILRWVGVM